MNLYPRDGAVMVLEMNTPWKYLITLANPRESVSWLYNTDIVLAITRTKGCERGGWFKH